jgi:hypothetical protein
MTWSATLKELNYDLEKTNDKFELVVDFNETDGRKFKKNYTFWVDELTDITLDSFKATLKKDLDKLAKIDSIRDVLVSKLGAKLE